jgi:hypothetical protein
MATSLRTSSGRFDGTWSYDDADLAVLSLPVLAALEDASAAFRLLLEDLGHYGVARTATTKA